MSTEQPNSNVVGQNQQTSSRLIGVLTILIPVITAIVTGVMTWSQKRMEIQVPISATQTAEANYPIFVISTSVSPTAVLNTENAVDNTQVNGVNVLLNNPNSDAPSMQLIIKHEDKIIANLILPPGGTVPRINLPPGSYQVEARPIYPPITPRSIDCEIQWQLAESYTRDLVITSGEAVIQIQQFDLKPLEICPTDTPIPQTPTPSP